MVAVRRCRWQALTSTHVSFIPCVRRCRLQLTWFHWLLRESRRPTRLDFHGELHYDGDSRLETILNGREVIGGTARFNERSNQFHPECMYRCGVQLT